MKRFLKAFLFFSLIAFSFYLVSEPHYTPTAIATPAHHALFPRYIAHKSIVSENHRGNTWNAMEEALRSPVDGLEVDVRLSKDNIPFLYHGDTLEESTTGTGAPEDYTWNQLQTFTYTDKLQSKLILLEDLFKFVGSQKYLFLDIKSSKVYEPHFAQIIADLIEKYYLHETVVVESFNPIFLTIMRLTNRSILLMYNFTTNATAMGEETQSQFDKIPWLLKQSFFQKQVRRVVRPDILGPRWNVAESELKCLMEKGYPIISWTVDDPHVAHHLFELGVKGIETNIPLTMMHTIKSAPVVYDAGGTKATMAKVIHVTTPQDIQKALKEAKTTHKKITIAGRRHSMGGQALLDQSILLNMLGMNRVHYHEDSHVITVEAGATWKKIQSILDDHNRSIKIMQSDNIFTVGGSISANVHGWQVASPPLSSTILSLKMMTADGTILTLSLDKEPDLFKAVIGGYGQLGVILEADLLTVPNSSLKFYAEYMKPEDFAAHFKERISHNPHVELAYGRLSVNRSNLFEEAGLFWYEKTDEISLGHLVPETLIALKRAIFRASQYFDLGKSIRWSAEKTYANQLMQAPPMTRNMAMNTDIHILWPLYGKNKDILHEYFIPKDKGTAFLMSLKDLVIQFDMNLLNATIREVRQDTISLLPYAKEDVFGYVLLFSQEQTPEEEEKMAQFTKKLIDVALSLQGTFYLPYRRHYDKNQLLKAYPKIRDWMVIKEKWDHQTLFDSQFYEQIRTLFPKL